MKKEIKEKIAWGLITFEVFCYLGNYYLLIFFRDIILERFAESAVMFALWPMCLWLILVLFACLLLDSAEEDIQKGGNYEDN